MNAEDHEQKPAKSNKKVGRENFRRESIRLSWDCMGDKEEN